MFSRINSCNKIIPVIFFSLISLSGNELFSYSDIQELPKDAFRGLSTLKEIQVSNGAVKTLDKNVFGGQRNLKFLRLHNNNITAINRGTFDFGQSLELLGREILSCLVHSLFYLIGS